MASPIIHIGYPKTGTTYLQKNIYPHLQGIKFYDYKIADDLFYELIYLDDLDYDGDKEKEKFRPLLDSTENSLFSFESLTGAPFIYKGANRSLIPSRLKNLGFEKVIITIRNQVDIIDSLYRQYVVQGGVMKFKDFLDIDQKWKLSVRPFHTGYLNYDKLASRCIEVFGKENVLILQQENFRGEFDEIRKKLIHFTGSTGFVPGKPDRSNESLTNLFYRSFKNM